MVSEPPFTVIVIIIVSTTGPASFRTLLFQRLAPGASASVEAVAFDKGQNDKQKNQIR